MAVIQVADRTWGPTTKRVLKGMLTILVLGFVARHVAQTRRDLLARGVTWKIDPAWLALAVACYVAGLVAFGAYFWRVLARSDSPVGCYIAIRAYLVSHLAKYVPGKAMVVVVRSALVAESGVRPATAAFATLYETLAMMAAGGLVAAAGFLITTGGRSGGPSSHFALPWDRQVEVTIPFAGLAVVAGLGFLVLVWPSVFPKLAGLIRKPLRGVGADALPRFTMPLLVEGLLWAAIGWLLLGASQVAVLAGIGAPGWADDPGIWPAAVASVALATVAGFAVPIAPGGLGVREWVLWTALAASLDQDWAVVAALMLRLVWVVGEIVAAAIVFVGRPRPRQVPG